MKHLLLVLLTYVAAVVETTFGNGLLHVDSLCALAAVVLLTQRFETAMLWLLLIGTVADCIGAEMALGTHALAYVGIGFLIRSIISRLHEQPVHVLCLSGLGFLATALVAIAMVRHQTASLPDWAGTGMTVATAWLLTVSIVAVLRGIAWLVRRFQQQSGSGGAMGSPVGLSVN